MFCEAFLSCSKSHWADTAAIVQPNWQQELPSDKKQNIVTSGRPRV